MKTQKQKIIDIMKADEELGLYEEPKQETLEEDAERYIQENIAPYSENKYMYKKCFIDGAKWQQERSYSEEDMIEAFLAGVEKESYRGLNFDDWFEQFKKK